MYDNNNIAKKKIKEKLKKKTNKQTNNKKHIQYQAPVVKAYFVVLH